MNIEQQKALQNRGIQEGVLDKEQMAISEQFEKDAGVVKAMTASEGWKVVKKYLESTIKYKREQMDVVDLSSTEAYRTQADIRAMKLLLSYIENQ